ncbi:MAG: transporter substrate-binding domain-containing protein [Symploca sp. SIO3C6]|uniref:Transporter substrate-binding domain-containing protein n=1 Tax=Symploca sp. SIO1C4 TaxID=2607765 RepID=A0A6B3N1H5_9CYAN|nr:transporter substrate-binding domain-containing protein [Symploca sp. SIO3C6]NER27526.1 transporter substrate-binding domain-containing protein [Symploca sp. SIO1C4]
MASNKFLPFSLAIGLTILSTLAHSTAQSAELDEIKRRGELIVAVKDNLRPLGFLETNGQLQGFEIDIARRLAVELLGDAEALVLQPVANNQRLKVVLEEEVDLAIARVTATDSRSRIVYLSIPYYLDSTGLVTKDASITKLKDLQSKKIAVLNSSSTIAVVQYNLPEAQLVGVDSYQEALQLLEQGTADAFAADNSLLTGWVQEYPEYKMLPVKLSSEALCIVIPKGLQYSQLQRRVNEAIAKWKAEGWLAERAAAWGLP